MPSESILILYFMMWYCLIGLAVLFIISGLDDLFIDAYYWGRNLVRLWKGRHYQPLTYAQLSAKPEKLIAVLVPCWHEANVIGVMLKHNCYSIDYDNYYIFVGVYPNDPDTVEEVQEVAKQNKHVRCVIGETPGPTNKASNLNGIYTYIKELEKELDQNFDIFVFHDSEDIIHPMSFKLYNYLTPNKEMIQIPVFPLHVKYWNFTHWLYADEFSENHTKDIIVREAIGGHVPSAGVGTAFTRHALNILENPETGTPFSIDSLTEDYRTSLSIRVRKLKQIFVVQKVVRTQWRPRGFLRKGYVQKPVKEYIATRAMFPTEYSKAVRQKARWIIGIVFQEWQNTKWPKEWAIRYTLAHDRKSFITHFINGFGYVLFLFWLLYTLLTFIKPEYPSLQEQLNLNPWVWYLIICITIIMFERMLQRMIAIYKVYDWKAALLSLPRAFYGNLLNLHALIRAYKVYYVAPKPHETTSKQPVWDKTDHQFPGSHILTPYRIRLGDLLINKSLITQPQLQDAMIQQQQTGERLGTILTRLNLINPEQLMRILAEQYHLDIFSLNSSDNLTPPDLPKKILERIAINHAIALAYDPIKNIITIGIVDPTNELLIEKIINSIEPYKIKFVLVNEALLNNTGIGKALVQATHNTLS